MKGRGESGNAMLDLSVFGLAIVVDFVGGWLGVAGSEDAGEAPPECRGARASSLESCLGNLMSSPSMLHASRDQF